MDHHINLKNPLVFFLGLAMKRGGLAPLLLFAILAVSPAAAQTPESFIWQLESPQGHRAYIMGSIHLAHSGLYPLHERIMKAFGESGVLVVEINSEDMAPGLMESFILEYGYSKERLPLQERVSPRTRQALIASGLYQPHMEPMAPWLAALSITVEALHQHGFRGEYGLDKFFIKETRKRGMEILELETIYEQMGMLAEMSTDEAELFLFSSILEMDELPGLMREFLETWQNGDVEGFKKAFFNSYHKYPELKPVMDIIIFRRNLEMAAKINDLTAKEDRVCFIVVGAGHLVGERSILAELTGRGWKASQL